MMTQAQKALVCMVGVFAFCSGASFGISNDYESIITNRNVFQLKPPPPPAPPPDPNPKPPAPKIILTGITTILGEPLALFKCTPPAAKGEQAKEKDYTLGVNQREDEIEVKSIDPAKGVVQVDDYGTITNLTFEKDGAKGPSGPPANGAPNPGIPQPTPFNPGMRTIPQRTLRFPGALPGAGPGSPRGGGGSMGGASATPTGGATPLGGGPSMNLNGTSVSMTGGAPQSGQPQIAGQDLVGGDMTPEAYAVMLEAQREVTKDDVTSGKMPPLPVNPRFTPAGSPGMPPEENPNEPTPTTATPSGVYVPPMPGRPPGLHPY